MVILRRSKLLKETCLAAYRLSRERRGDTAIEFALIGTAFFLFVFGFFILSLDQYLQMALDDAVRTVARQVSIGAITSTSTPNVGVAICNRFGIIAADCTGRLQISVVGGTGFATTPDATTPIFNLQAQLGQNGLTGPAVSFDALAGAPFTGVAATVPPQPPGQTAPSPPIQGLPRYIIIQAAYPAPFQFFSLLPASFGTENGTSFLYSSVTIVSEP